MFKNKIYNKIICISTLLVMLAQNAVYAHAADTVSKNESVFVTLSQDGSQREAIVSDWLHSDSGIKNVQDKSIIKNIVNLKGNEVPVINGDKVEWNSESNDLYYQGNTDKETPISVKIRYYLDGKETKPEDMAGKSGTLRMKIDYINRDIHSVNINGKNRNIGTLFTTITVVNLPNDFFTNVKVNGGQVLSDGNRQVVGFVCFPGLKESLEMGSDLVNIPETLEITADVKDFRMGPVYITATPELPDIKGLKDANNITELINGISQLKDASQKLSDGAAKLAEGSKTLAVNLDSLKAGIDKLGSASKDLKKGIDTLGQGAKSAKIGAQQVADGVKQLADGSKTLGEGAQQFGTGAQEYAASSGKLAAGAVQVADGAAQIASKTGELETGINKLVDATEQLKAGESQITQGSVQSLQAISQLKAGKQKEIQAYDLLLAGNTGLEKLCGMLANIPVAKDISDKLLVGLEQQRAALTGLKDSSSQYIMGLTQLENGIEAMKTGSEKLSAGLGSLQEGQKTAAAGAQAIAAGGAKLAPAAKQLQDGSAALKVGADKLNQAAIGLNTGAQQFNTGSQKLVAGSQAVAQGLLQLTDGTSKLSAGADEFSDGFDKLSLGAAKLTDGAHQLNSGADELSLNMAKFNNEGVKKMDSEVSSKIGDVQELLDVKDSLIKLSDEYITFTGIGENMTGSVKFIMKTDEIKQKEAVQQTTAVTKTESKGFLAWLKKLFNR